MGPDDSEPLDTSSFSLLAAELKIRVLSFLDARTLICCRLVCQLWKAIVDETAALQYMIELYVAGIEDGTRRDLSYADKLDLLRKHQVAWNKLKWHEETDILRLTGDVWELYGGLFAQSKGARHLKFWQLPSRLRGIEEKTWEIPDVGVEVRDFTMDASQDLLVLLTRPPFRGTRIEGRYSDIHLRRLFDGSAHPLAPDGAMLEHYQENVPGSATTYVFQISGEHLGVLFLCGHLHQGPRDSELLIWQWTTGKLCLHISGRELRSFAFLNEHHVILSIIHIPPSNQDQLEPSLLVINFVNASPQKATINDCNFEYCFAYPATSGNMIPIELSIRSDPTPTFRPGNAVPFHVDRNQRLFAITLWALDATLVCSLLLFVPSSTFLSHLNDRRMSATKGRYIPWEDWGPEGTRFFASPWHSTVWVCYVYGMQFIVPGRPHHPGPELRNMLQVYDFNPLSATRALSEATDDFQVITEPSLLPPVGVFRDNVTTSLPYRIKTATVDSLSAQNRDFTHAMLSEDSIIVISPGTESNRLFRILTF